MLLEKALSSVNLKVRKGDPPPIVNSEQVKAMGAHSSHKLLASDNSSGRNGRTHTPSLTEAKFREEKDIVQDTKGLEKSLDASRLGCLGPSRGARS